MMTCTIEIIDSIHGHFSTVVLSISYISFQNNVDLTNWYKTCSIINFITLQ